LAEQLCRERVGCAGIVRREPDRAGDAFHVIGIVQLGAQTNPVTLLFGQRCDGGSAITTNTREECPFGHNTIERRAMVDRYHKRAEPRVIGANLNANRALGGGREHRFQRNGRASLRHVEPFEPSRSEQGSVNLARFELRQPRRDIPAKQHNLQIGAQPQQLRSAARRAGTDYRALLQRDNPRATNQPITDICALQHRGEPEMRRALRLDIFHRMDREIDLAAGKRLIEFLGPQRFSANLGKRAILNLVTRRNNRDKSDCILREAVRGDKRIGDQLCLCACEWGRAGSET